MPRTRARRAALAALCVLPLAIGTAAALPAQAKSNKTPTVSLAPIGTYSTGAFDEGASEIVAHDPIRQRLFVVNAQAGTVDVLDINDPTKPSKVATLATPGVNSVAVHGDTVAVAEQAARKTDPGTIAFFDANTYAKTGQVTVGALPDMVTFTRNGDYALSANEGEPEGYCAGQVDPEGSVSIIDLRAGVANATVKTATFTGFAKAALIASGVRIYGPNATAAQDLEPEYIATSNNSKTAWVTLQENNAIATVDIRSGTVTAISALGLKDHSKPGNGLDASDKDKKINIANWPVRGMYLPDGIASYKMRNAEYLVTANEGDARDWDCFAEEARIKDVTLDPKVFPNAKALQDTKALGRLNISAATSPKGPAGYTELHVLGGRSISVRDSSGALVWDSGDALEKLTAANNPVLFNADHAEADSFDTRSDNKGPEPEGLDLGKIGGRTYAFVGLERNSGIAVFDLTDPRAGRVAGFGINRDPAGGIDRGDLGPEGVHFIAAEDSPTGAPLLAVGNEVSGTTTLWSVSVD